MKTKKLDVDWDTKCNKIIFTQFRGNAATRYGKANEKPALHCFSQMYPDKNILTEIGFCVNQHFPSFGFSPDGIMDEDILLEVKCPISGSTLKGAALCDKLPYLVQEGPDYMLKKTHTYFTQIQLGLFVLNFKLAKMIVYYNVKSQNIDEQCKNDEGVLVINVARDDEFLNTLIPTLISRYFEFILPFLFKNRTKLLLNEINKNDA